MFFAGIDLGTSGCRLIVINYAGDIQYETRIEYEDATSQTPELWWQSVTQLLHTPPKNITQHLATVCVDGTSGTLLLTNLKGVPTTPALMYNDTTAMKEAEQIKQLAPDSSGAHGAGSSLSKLLYLLKKHPNKAHAHALHQADWISNKLMGQFGFSDENNCLKLGFDSVNSRWPDWIKTLGFSSTLLPTIKPAGGVFGRISNEIAQQFNLPKNVKIVAGTTDSIAAFIATQSSKIGDAVTSLGSTLAIKIISKKPIFAANMGVYSHRLGDIWLVGGASNTGCACLNKYFSLQQLQVMTPQLNPEKTLDLKYYPLPKIGERFPIAEPNKQPKFSPRPDNDVDFFQAILEGIANIEAASYETLQKLGAPFPKTIYTVGGGSKNPAWESIRKKKISSTIKMPEYTEAAYGAALLGCNC